MRDVINVLIIGSGDGLGCGAPGSTATPVAGLVVSGPVPASTAAFAVARRAVDVVLVTMRRSAVEVVREVRAVSPSVRALVEAEVPSVLAADVLAAGGSGVIRAGLPDAIVWDAVIRAYRGDLVLDDDDLRQLVASLATAPAATATPALTQRELEVLNAIAQGRTTTEIAGSLGVRPVTVQAHVKNVLTKLRAHSKLEAVRIAWREGLVAVPA